MNLRNKHPKMRGSAVRRLQELLDDLGFDEGANDGIFGPATERAVKEFQVSHDLAVDGICGPKTWAAIEGSPAPVRSPANGIVDIADIHPHPKLYKCQRDPSRIDSIVIHQTGCAMPTNPTKWARLNAHIGITREGIVILANDFTDWIWHAQGLSRNSIGVEIEGNFCGIQDNLKTLWKGGGGPHNLTAEQLAALPVLISLLDQESDRLKFSIDHIFAHRQSKDMRTADPGSEIWGVFGLPLQDRFNADDGGAKFHTGTGRPIPREWDSRRTTKYWS